MRKLILTLLVLTLGMALGSSHLLANSFAVGQNIPHINIPRVNVFQNSFQNPTIPSSLVEIVGQRGMLPTRKSSYQFKLVVILPVVETRLILDTVTRVILLAKLDDSKIKGKLVYSHFGHTIENECSFLRGEYFGTLACDLIGLEPETSFTIQLVNVADGSVVESSPVLTVKNLTNYGSAEDAAPPSAETGAGDENIPPADDTVVPDDLPLNDDPAVVPPGDAGADDVPTDAGADAEDNSEGGGFACSLNSNADNGSGASWILFAGLLGVFIMYRLMKRHAWIAFVIVLLAGQTALADRCGYLKDQCRFPNEGGKCSEVGIDNSKEWSEMK